MMLSGRLLLQSIFFIGLCQAYGSKCHRLCNCDANTINCTNVGDQGLEILRSLNSYDFMDLNYLLINGARLGDLPDRNIFGMNVHRKLHTIRFMNTGITSFGPGVFSGAPNLKFLDLDENPLRDVRPHSLQHLNDLKSLSLKRIFDADRQNNRQVLASIFDSPLPRLQNISLHGNELRFEVGSVLCKFPRLLRVDLSDNRLESFSLPHVCIAPIEELYLHDNDLTELPGLSNVPLKKLTLYNNPLNCEWDVCEEKEMLNVLLNTTTTFCAFPAKQKGASFAELMAQQTCSSSSSLIRNILICLGLIVVAAMISIWWNGCFNRMNYQNKNHSYDMVRLSADVADPTYV